MKRSETTKKPIEILTNDELRSLMGVCNRSTPTGLRDCALIATLADTAGRLSEVLDLIDQNIDFNTGVVLLLGKGAKYRRVQIGKETLDLLKSWMLYRNKIATTNLLFPTISKGRAVHMSQQHIRQMLTRRAQKAGIEKRIHPHGFRHTRAVQWHRNGVPLKIIQKALGHSFLSTTDRYIDHIDAAEVCEAISMVRAY